MQPKAQEIVNLPELGMVGTPLKSVKLKHKTKRIFQMKLLCIETQRNTRLRLSKTAQCQGPPGASLCASYFHSYNGPAL